MQTKRRMTLAILALRSMPYAVRQDCLELIEIRAHHIDMLIDNEPSEVLPHPLPHHARLAMMNREAFLQ